MVSSNLFAVRHVNSNYEEKGHYLEVLCFKAPHFLNTGDLGILDANYWLRTIKKDNEHPLIADLNFPYMQIPMISSSDVESRRDNFVTLRCCLIDRAFEKGKSIFIRANDPFLPSLWKYLSGLCVDEGFNLSRRNWEEYKEWSKNKFKSIAGN